ncbi:MAG: hypothetical protein HYZ62_02035 [Candidatus Andersenbacteria bacterium]|nr:hypothetical protein [Candidatus Andersenbacteria bacterium]
MKSDISISKRAAVFLILAGIAGIFFFCAANQPMVMNSMGHARFCGVSPTADLCPMAFSGRLNFWQNLIVPVSSVPDVLALLMFLAALAFFWSHSLVLALIQFGVNRMRQDGCLPMSNYLLAQFSQGILRPKIY